MEYSNLQIRARQIMMGLIGLGIASFFIIPPLMAPQYEVQQGPFQARILSSASGMGMGGKPILRARVEDETGRIFWIGVPSTIIVAPETPIMINVWCETDAYESCIGRYTRRLSED